MHVAQADTQGNANIGLYAYATNTHCILGPEAENLKSLIEEVLQVEVIITTIAGTSLAGVFCSGHDDIVLVPAIAFEHEVEALTQAGLDVRTITTTHTALGNNLVATSKGALAGPMFNDDEIHRISKALEAPVHALRLADIEVVGSGVATNSTGCIAHPNSSQFEQDLVKDTLGLKRVLPGTVNFGNPYVRSGIIANDKGFLIGKQSGGPEITNADEALGFIEG